MRQAEQSLHESLSAVMDSEAEELELRRVVNAATDDPRVREKWQRLHLVRGVMHNEQTARAGAESTAIPIWPPYDGTPDEATREVTGSVPAGAGNQSAATDPDAKGGRRPWVAPVGGTLLAAAAALLVVVFFGGTAPGIIDPEPTLADVPNPVGRGGYTSQEPALNGAGDGMQQGVLDRAATIGAPSYAATTAHGLGSVPSVIDLERANAYIYQHARGTSVAARPAAMPFVKELSTLQGAETRRRTLPPGADTMVAEGVEAR